MKGAVRHFELFDKYQCDYLDKHERDLGAVNEGLQKDTSVMKLFLIFCF